VNLNNTPSPMSFRSTGVLLGVRLDVSPSTFSQRCERTRLEPPVANAVCGQDGCKAAVHARFSRSRSAIAHIRVRNDSGQVSASVRLFTLCNVEIEQQSAAIGAYLRCDSLFSRQMAKFSSYCANLLDGGRPIGMCERHNTGNGCIKGGRTQCKAI
jgi:hypothetical protein